MPSQIPDVLGGAAVGVRVYSGSQEHLDKSTIPQIAAMVKVLRGKVGKVFLGVWQDEGQPHSDFGGRGGTYAALSALYLDDSFVEVLVVDGDLFVSAINKLAEAANEKGFEYFLTLSASVHHLLTAETMCGINMGFARGALIVGVTSPDNPITEQGACSHTCTAYHLPTLIECGGTDVRDVRPAEFTPATSNTGVCEMFNVIVWTKKFERSVLQMVVPNVGGGDVRMDPGHPEHATHMAKLALKKTRADGAFHEYGFLGEMGWQALKAAQIGESILAADIIL